MRGSVQILKKKPGGSKMPKVSHKPDKLLVGTKKMRSSVNLEQEQQLEAPHRGHIEQVLSVNLAFFEEDLRVLIRVFMLS
jgi:translation elongation factor EF-Tu-like GTPase